MSVAARSGAAASATSTTARRGLSRGSEAHATIRDGADRKRGGRRLTHTANIRRQVLPTSRASHPFNYPPAAPFLASGDFPSMYLHTLVVHGTPPAYYIHAVASLSTASKGHPPHRNRQPWQPLHARTTRRRRRAFRVSYTPGRGVGTWGKLLWFAEYRDSAPVVFCKFGDDRAHGAGTARSLLAGTP